MAYESTSADKKPAEGGDSSKDIPTARKQLQYAIEVYDQNRRDQLDDVRFAAANPDNMWHWPEQVRNARLNKNQDGGARPVLTINKLPQHIRLVTNEQRQNRPSIKVIPVDSAADVEVADVLNGIIRHIEANSDADTAYDTACENQVTHGEGYARVLTGYVDDQQQDEQDILIARIKNSFSVYMDPDGLRKDPTGRYCEWVFITDKVKRDKFKDEYPQAKQTNWDVLGTGDAKGWVEADDITVAEYFCVKKVNGRRVVMWQKMTALEVLEEREWAGKYIPVVRMVGNEYEVDGRLVISGLVRNSKDACRMYNYWVSQEAEILALAPKAPYIGDAEQFENHEDMWADSGVTNFAFLKYNAVVRDGVLLPPPQRSAPPIPPAGFIQAKLGAADDIQSTVGQYNPSLGAEAQEKSGKAIVARQRQADVGTFHYMDNLAKGIRQLGRILVDLIPKIYDTRRVARILGEDGEPDHVTIDPDQQQAVMKIEDGDEIQKIYNPGIGTYDVRVAVGPSYTTQRQETAQMMIELSQGVTDPQIALVMRYLAIKNMDWSGAEDLAGIIKRMLPPGVVDEDKNGSPEMRQAQQMIEQMQQQMQQMMGVIEQLQTGQEAQKLEIERFNAETKRMEAESKDKERQFSATVDYVDRTVVDDTALLAPGGNGAIPPQPPIAATAAESGVPQ